MTDQPVAGVPRPDAPRSPLADGQWHRVHPLTPLFRGGLTLVIFAGIVITNFRDRLIEWFLSLVMPGLPEEERPADPVDYVIDNGLILLALVAVLAVVLVLIGVFYVSWRFHTFRITGDTVEVRSGVLFRSHRRAPLDRVQGVNLTRPMVARLAGMAKLEVVGAGLDANVTLEYLSTANAEAVRADILRLASGRRLAEAQATGRTGAGSLVSVAAATVSDGITGLIVGAEEPVAEPQSVVHLRPGRLVASRLLSGSTIGLLVPIGVIVWGSIVDTPWMLVGMIPPLIGLGVYWMRSITKALRYSIAPTPDGVRITFGLFTTVTEILPPGRVHAVEVSQPVLWRPVGWWSVRVNRIFGRSRESGQGDQFSTVLPVGDRADVERVLRLLLPGMPEGGWHAVFEHGVLGPRADDPYTNTPSRARILRLLSWRRNGFLVAPDALFLRRGVVWRSLAIFPLARLQSVGLDQGPIDRALRVAGARAHTIAGPVSGRLGAIDRDAALGLFSAVAGNAVVAAAGDHSHRWAGEPAPQVVEPLPGVGVSGLGGTGALPPVERGPEGRGETGTP
ncbi:MAG: PH domain-containing protein [Microbacterium sp.]